jgi:hypothetical protein
MVGSSKEIGRIPKTLIPEGERSNKPQLKPPVSYSISLQDLMALT